MYKKIKRILISTGGSGGHIIPALSLNNFFLNMGISVKLTTDKRGLKYLEKNPKLNIGIINSDTIFKNNKFKFFISILK